MGPAYAPSAATRRRLALALALGLLAPAALAQSGSAPPEARAPRRPGSSRAARPAQPPAPAAPDALFSAASDVRGELQAFATALDRAVRRVSRASASASVSARGYHLPGTGAVFVLPARVLPVRRAAAVDRQAARGLAEAVAHVESSLARVRSPELRAKLQQTLEALRQTQVELRQAVRGRSGSGEAAPVLAHPDPELDVRDAHRDARREAERRSQGLEAQARRELEAQVRAMHAQMEAFRRQAEEERARVEHEVRVRLGVTPPPAEPPLPAVPPASSVPAAPAAVPALPGLPPPTPPDPPEPGMPFGPPWSFWVEVDEGPEAGGDPDTVVAGVRSAVLAALEAQGARLRRLRPEETVTVAVDFVPRSASARSRTRTLVVSARKRDLDERRAGRLSAEEFRRRAQVSEY